MKNRPDHNQKRPELSESDKMKLRIMSFFAYATLVVIFSDTMCQSCDLMGLESEELKTVQNEVNELTEKIVSK